METRLKKILIVDDLLTARRLLIMDLNKAGKFEIDIAENGKVALSKIDEAQKINDPFNIIFMDWNMPVLDGLSVLKIIKTNKVTMDIFVVMITAETDPDNVKLLNENKADLIINKPLNNEKIKLIMSKLATK